MNEHDVITERQPSEGPGGSIGGSIGGLIGGLIEEEGGALFNAEYLV